MWYVFYDLLNYWKLLNFIKQLSYIFVSANIALSGIIFILFDCFIVTSVLFTSLPFWLDFYYILLLLASYDFILRPRLNFNPEAGFFLSSSFSLCNYLFFYEPLSYFWSFKTFLNFGLIYFSF